MDLDDLHAVRLRALHLQYPETHFPQPKPRRKLSVQGVNVEELLAELSLGFLHLLL